MNRNKPEIIVGLGNPGKKYEATRHNAGFWALDALAKKLGLEWERSGKFTALVAGQANDCFLVKPLTGMNNSGRAVRAIFDFYKLLPKKFGLMAIKDIDLSGRLTVIHDDIDLDLGRYKWSTDSRSAGHRGVQSIIDHLKTKNFRRLRLGVRGQRPAGMPTAAYVLSRMPEGERDIAGKIIEKAVKEV